MPLQLQNQKKATEKLMITSKPEANEGFIIIKTVFNMEENKIKQERTDVPEGENRGLL